MTIEERLLKLESNALDVCILKTLLQDKITKLNKWEERLSKMEERMDAWIITAKENM